MAYRRYSSSRSSYGRRGRSSGRRRTRKTKSRRAPAQRIVIQVIGGPGGMVPISATAGKKGKRNLRNRH